VSKKECVRVWVGWYLYHRVRFGREKGDSLSGIHAWGGIANCGLLGRGWGGPDAAVGLDAQSVGALEEVGVAEHACECVCAC
jgi:hypothetical protein